MFKKGFWWILSRYSANCRIDCVVVSVFDGGIGSLDDKRLVELVFVTS